MADSVVSYRIFGDDELVVIQNSRGKFAASSSPGELLQFLRYSEGGVSRIFWDLDANLSVLLRLLPSSILERLAAFDEDLTYHEHQLYYLPERMFRVGRSRFYGIKHFWSTGEPTPSTLEEVQDKAEELVTTLTDCGMPDFTKLTSPIAIFEQTELGKETYANIPKGYELPPSCFEAIQFASRADRREWISAYQVGCWVRVKSGI